MKYKNDVNSYIASLTGHGVYQYDPLTRREMGHYARQVEMGNFFARVAKSLSGMIKGWFVRNRQFRELNTLSDHVLKDMGFTRDQISQVVNNELRRPEMSLSPTGPQSAPAFSQPKKDTSKDTGKDSGEDKNIPLAA